MFFWRVPRNRAILPQKWDAGPTKAIILTLFQGTQVMTPLKKVQCDWQARGLRSPRRFRPWASRRATKKSKHSTDFAAPALAALTSWSRSEPIKWPCKRRTLSMRQPQTIVLLTRNQPRTGSLSPRNGRFNTPMVDPMAARRFRPFRRSSAMRLRRRAISASC